MSILIKGMEMPTEGGTIVVYKISGKYFAARAGKEELFPLRPVPDHGRLIDADALRTDWLENGENEYVYDTNAFLDSIDSAPTIIPAEESER